MEQHHPIMDKLGGLGGRTYRQTDSRGCHEGKILGVYEPAWLAALEDNIHNFVYITAFEMLQHPKEKYLELVNTEE